jgi:hypothetical protein
MAMVLVIKTSLFCVLGRAWNRLELLRNRMKELLDSSTIHRRSQYPFAEEDEYSSNYMASNDKNQALESAIQELSDRKLA